MLRLKLSNIKLTLATRYIGILRRFITTWWRHQLETFSALLAICAGNSPVPGEFPAQRPVTRSFDVFLDLRLNKRLSKQPWGWWFETPSCSLRRHFNAEMLSYKLMCFSWNTNGQRQLIFGYGMVDFLSLWIICCQSSLEIGDMFKT